MRLSMPPCPFRLLTGRPCPACGLTGSVSAALRGHLRRAAALHRLGPVVAAAVVVAALDASRPRAARGWRPVSPASRHGEFVISARAPAG